MISFIILDFFNSNWCKCVFLSSVILVVITLFFFLNRIGLLITISILEADKQSFNVTWYQSIQVQTECLQALESHEVDGDVLRDNSLATKNVYPIVLLDKQVLVHLVNEQRSNPTSLDQEQFHPII